MPLVTDRAVIRAILEKDRIWSVYALGDLAPGLFEQCTWYRPAGEGVAVVLLCRIIPSPILFVLGEPGLVRPLLEEMAGEKEMYLHIRPEILPLLRERYDVRHEKTMWRLALPPDRFCPLPHPDAVRLGPSDLPALRRLFADGDSAGEAPDFFFPSMVADGVFYGIHEGKDLIAAAGTHLVVPAEGIGSIGNVYTRRDRRGHGLAGALTSAVAAELLRTGIRTVALNVHEGNAAAIRVYERVGFTRHGQFKEGVVVRRGA
jgi:GNAT superfamily N-acetyltransferase